MEKTEIPNLKKELIEQFGYISFQLILANIDVIGIRIKSSWETVIITYKGKDKVGFIYEGGELSQAKVIAIYKDVPDDYNKLTEFEKLRGEKIEILQMPKDNYVFLNDREVAKAQKPIKKVTN